MRTNKIIIAFVTLALLIGFSGRRVANSQSEVAWVPKSRIPEYLDDTFPPVMVADQNNTVYAFASQWVGDESPQVAIIFRRWTKSGGWTPPIDVLLSPSGDAILYDAYLDPWGIVHVIFRGGNARNSSVYYARAPIQDAGRASSWSAPLLISTGAVAPGSGAISGDGQGHLVIIFGGARDGLGIYEAQSADSGLTWNDPTSLFFTFDSQLIPFSAQLSRDHTGRIHAVWNVVSSQGVDQSAHYASYDGTTGVWSEPMMLDERIEKDDYFGPSFPAIASGSTHLAVMYNSGNPFSGGEVPAGRPVQRVRLSPDFGTSWNSPTNPFPRHLGRSGSHALAVDSTGSIHAVFIQRTEGSVNGEFRVVGGLWHSQLQNGVWSEPTLFDLGEMSGHDLSAVISQGNVLLVTWREDPGTGEEGVWFTYAPLDAPALPAAPPQVMTITAAQPTATVTARPAVPTATPMAVAFSAEPPATTPSISGDPARPLIYGLIPVLLILIAVIAIRQFSLRRR